MPMTSQLVHQSHLGVKNNESISQVEKSSSVG